MKEIARAEVNSVVPFGFHGAFKCWFTNYGSMSWLL
jgi:carotenoid cleavage dioxygenase-like enzyme